MKSRRCDRIAQGSHFIYQFTSIFYGLFEYLLENIATYFVVKLILDFNRVIEHMRLTTHERTLLRGAGPDVSANRLHHLSFTLDTQCSGVARVLATPT